MVGSLFGVDGVVREVAVAVNVDGIIGHRIGVGNIRDKRFIVVYISRQHVGYIPG